MTIYEQLQDKIDLLRHAGDNCMRNGKTGMAIIWYTKSALLIDQQDDMPTDVAGCVVV
jgi:hypothetical protein